MTDMDELDDGIKPEDPEIERRLDAYADARLTPTDDAMARIRANVQAQVDLAVDPTAGPSTAATTRAAPTTRVSGRRRVWIGLAAASLTLVILAGGAVVGARPGGPLYATSLSIEAANLPTQVAERIGAEIDRLERRIAEARSATTGSDAGAADAALTAYASIVTTAGAESSADATARATLADRLNQHVTVLSGLLTTVPPAAAGAATQALQSCTMTLDALDQP